MYIYINILMYTLNVLKINTIDSDSVKGHASLKVIHQLIFQFRNRSMHVLNLTQWFNQWIIDISNLIGSICWQETPPISSFMVFWNISRLRNYFEVKQSQVRCTKWRCTIERQLYNDLYVPQFSFQLAISRGERKFISLNSTSRSIGIRFSTRMWQAPIDISPMYKF